MSELNFQFLSKCNSNFWNINFEDKLRNNKIIDCSKVDVTTT